MCTMRGFSPFYLLSTLPIKLQGATHSHSSPDLESGSANLERFLREGGTTGSFRMVTSRNMTMDEREIEIKDTGQKKLDAFEDVVLPPEHEEPTYKPDHDEEHDPLLTMEMAWFKMEEFI